MSLFCCFTVFLTKPSLYCSLKTRYGIQTELKFCISFCASQYVIVGCLVEAIVVCVLAMTTIRLSKDVDAWNADGSSSDKIDEISWIQFWHEKTKIKTTVPCSFSGCPRQAEVGGHIWISGRHKNVFIAPICRKCNFSGNSSRMQNGGSQLRRHTVVVKVGMTREMRDAPRRFAIGERSCQSCGEDISDRPPDHTKCLGCFRTKGVVESVFAHAIFDPPKRNGSRRFGKAGRSCQSCGEDISDRPPNHTKCLGCFRTKGVVESVFAHAIFDPPKRNGPRRFGKAGRSCQSCGEDLSDRPPSHTSCLGCFHGDRY